MRYAISVAATLVAFTTASAAPSQSLCIAESAGRLHYDARTQSWRGQAFLGGNAARLFGLDPKPVKKIP